MLPSRIRPSILVIKLGALGDFVQAFPAFAAIRAHHPVAEITLLTTRPFVDLAQASPWFERIEIDQRPSWLDLRGVLALRAQLRGHERVYDLQTSGRSTRYFRLAGKPDWSGIAPLASLRHANSFRDVMHTRARQRDQLRMAGIAETPEADLGWLASGGPLLPQPYALLVPAAAAHRPGKRWPLTHFTRVATALAARGILPVVVGTKADAPLAAAIGAACPQALDLCGQTDLVALGGVCARAAIAIGNDTGPMHLAAAMGCRCLVLFSGESDPSLTAPLGRQPGQVRVMRAEDITSIAVERVITALDEAC